MDCQTAQTLFVPYVLGGADLSSDEVHGLEAHLSVCPECEEEVFETAQLVGLLRSLPADHFASDLSMQNDGLIVAKEIDSVEPRRAAVEEMPTVCFTAQSDPHFKTRKNKVITIGFLGPVISMAACIAICVVAGLWKHDCLQSALCRQDCKVEKTTIEPMGTVTALVGKGTDGITKDVFAGHILSARAGERLRVQIWNRHEITIEPETQLALEGSPNAGCRVKLGSGQITVSVNRSKDEGLFQVKTSKAELTVTGTVFTVESTAKKTSLAVTHGVVRIAAMCGQAQEVSAGQQYETDGYRLARVDGSTGTDSAAMLSQIAAEARDELASLRKSAWYQKHFAPLLHMRDYLLRHGQEVDELTLVAISADLWAIQCSKKPGVSHPSFRYRRKGLERAAQYCGCTVEWVTSCDKAEVEQLAKQAVAAGELALVYGVNEKSVVALDEAMLSQGVMRAVSSYRFLGDQADSGYVMARIIRSSVIPNRRELAGESLQDMRNLLTNTTDATQLVGEDAVAEWARHASDRMDGPSWNDPVFISLQAICKLALSCQSCYSRLGVPVDLRRWNMLAAELRIATDTRPGELEADDHLCAAERRQMWLDTAERLTEVLRQCTRLGSQDTEAN